MHFAIPFLVFTALLNLGLGLFVYLSNPKELSSRAFAVLTASISSWCVGIIIFYSVGTVDVQASAVKSYYISAMTMNASLLVFVGAFLGLPKGVLYVYFPVFSWLAFLVPLIFTEDFLFTIGKPLGHGSTVNLKSHSYLLYTFLILSYYVVALFLLYTNRNKQGERRKRQITSILLGLVTAGAFATYFNLYLPWINVYGYTWSGPLFTIIFVFFIAYAMLKHKLFDIRAVVARTFAYVLAISLLIVFYAGFTYILQFVASDSMSLSVSQLLLNMTLTIPLVLLYPYAKKRFDRVTNSIFYRDAYDPQQFLDDLNNVLVANIDTEELLKKSCKLIEKDIKSEFVSFFLLDTSYYDSRMVGDYGSNLSDDDANELHTLLPKIHRKVIYTLQDAETPQERRVIEILRARGISILVRVVNSVDIEVDGIGYLLLGQKRSGNPYTTDDVRILDIVGSELELAVENALRFEEIQQFNVTLQNRIDNATSDLQKSNKKLKALDEAKDEFISMASHQLRTPLTSVKGYVSMVADGDVGEVNDKQKEMLEQAMFSSQQMVNLIADLLNVSRLRTGKFVIDKQPALLPDIVQTEINQIRTGASAKDITLRYVQPSGFPELQLDETKIRQVIMNFVDNAIYYTPPGGVITVVLIEKSRTVEFSVVDSGIGVPKEQQHHLFTKFYRADNAKKTRPDGTGLGLFMAKKVIIGHGGSIIFKSVEGTGSTFGFSLPKDDSSSATDD